MTIRERDERDFLIAHRTGIGILWLLVIAALLMLLAGCGSTRTTTVTLDDAEPSVNDVVPDTIETALTPLPLADTPSMPTQALEVRRFAEPDTSSPARLFTALTFDRRSDRVRVRLQDESYTFRAPARGEALSIRPDTAGQLRAGVLGTPTPRTIQVQSDAGPSMWQRVQYGVAAVAGLLVLALLVRILS